MKRLFLSLLFFIFSFVITFAQNNPNANHGNKFEPLNKLLPTPNSYRTADGAPGPDYWQQKADYVINCTLNIKEHRLDGSETITYHNNSPSSLRYLWLQLDENEHDFNSQKNHTNTSNIKKAMSEINLKTLEPYKTLEKYGCKIKSVKDINNKTLKYTIQGTNMRIDLPKPLAPGEMVSFKVDWYYYLINRFDTTSWGRGGYEHFKDNDNYIYTIVQWFPRMAVYSDVEGWQNKQFLGTGEFALNFGDYEVSMTVPDDFMVGSTGTCSNYEQVLTPTQMQRWLQAQTASEPLQIVTLDEARMQENKAYSNKLKTWKFSAKNVRDFAWTASRKFVWDAMPYINEYNQKVMCMSYYGKEAYPIYSKYSTKAVAHTLETYDKYSIAYPYPIAISVEAKNGMEYPMICFNPGRAEEDGTYTEASKNAAITVIIHEVGHNYFPMIINSDERQWAWFDEGINSYLQFVAEQEWDYNYDSSSGPAHTIVDYMSQDKSQLEPIMTSADHINQYFQNAYSKPATALNILRETVMGRDAFDFAFKEFCQQWAFKHPTPADFFRSMEDASGVSLDWFWRGWFFSTDAVDIAIDSIKYYKVDLKGNPKKRTYEYKKVNKEPITTITQMNNKKEGIKYDVDEDSSLQDFYTYYKPYETVDSVEIFETQLYEEQFTKKEKKALFGDYNYYELYFSNKGGLLMPIILEWTYEDGSKEIERIPVNVWRKNENNITKVFVKDKKVTAVVLDPYLETADIDTRNNQWPIQEVPSKFQVFKKHKPVEKQNAMQRAHTRP